MTTQKSRGKYINLKSLLTNAVNNNLIVELQQTVPYLEANILYRTANPNSFIFKDRSLWNDIQYSKSSTSKDVKFFWNNKTWTKIQAYCVGVKTCQNTSACRVTL